MNKLTFEWPGYHSKNNGFRLLTQLILADNFLCIRHHLNCWENSGEQERQNRSLRELRVMETDKHTQFFK